MSLSPQRLQAPLGVLALFLAASLMVVGCDTTVNNVNSDEPVGAKGTVTGRVIDRVTSAPIQEATVALAAPSDTASGSSLTATTGENGKFEIAGVPANTSSGNSSSSTTYSLHVQTPSGSPYRSQYRAEVELAFGSAGDDAATNLAASVTLPLSKTNGTVEGRAYTSSGPLNGAEIGFVQTLPVQFDGDGEPTQTAEVLTATTTTDSTGAFTLSNVEVGTDFALSVRVGNSSDVFAAGTVPASSGNTTVKVGETDVSGVITPFRITEVSPAPDTDVSTATPSLTFTFNRPVVANDFTRTDVSGNLDGTLIEELDLSPDIKKDLRSDDNLPIEISFDSTRTRLTVTPSEPLEDGFIYEHDAEGFSDARFTDAFGIPLSNTSEGDFTFSVGLENSSPAVPSVAFQSGSKPTLNYDSNTDITADLEVNVDNSSAEVKGYEVYARTVDFTAERTGTSSQFRKIDDVDPEASSMEFDDADGIIPANEAEFGTLGFSATIDEPFNGDDTPLHADDGTYGPIEWKVRAVSVNNLRSDFTSVITTPDNVRPDLRTTQAPGLGNVNRGAYTDDDDGDGDPELIVQVDEPVDESNISGDASQFTVYEDGTTNERQDALSGINRIENKIDPPNDEATVVVIEIDEANYTPTADDDLVIEDTQSDGVTDLAGNPVVDNSPGTNPIDDDITN